MLRGREIARLQRRSQLIEQLADRARSTSAATVMMVMMALRLLALGLRCLALEVLLNVGEVLLRAREVSRLQVLAKLVERLHQRAAAGA